MAKRVDIEMTDGQKGRLYQKISALLREILEVAFELTKGRDMKTLRIVCDELLLETIAGMSKFQVDAANEATRYAAEVLGRGKDMEVK